MTTERAHDERACRAALPARGILRCSASPYGHRCVAVDDGHVDHHCVCGVVFAIFGKDATTHDIEALVAARDWAREHGHPQPDDRMLAAYGARVYDLAYRAGREDATEVARGLQPQETATTRGPKPPADTSWIRTTTPDQQWRERWDGGSR